MGTRADFYAKKRHTMQWLGSIALDGDFYSEDEQNPVRIARSLEQFRTHVSFEIMRRIDGTSPDKGWPWPWYNSHLTDYSYVYDCELGRVRVFKFGCEIINGHSSDATKWDGFPDMRHLQRVTGGERSGVIFIPSH